MSDNPVSLDLISRQQDRILAEIASFRDDMRVLTAIVLRLEGAQTALSQQMRAMVAQHQRFGDRLLGLDQRLRALEDTPQ